MIAFALAALAPPALAIHLFATKAAYRVGEPVVLKADGVNRSKTPIAFVKAELAMGRAPEWHLEWRRDGGRWEPVSLAIGVCGNSDFTLHREHVVQVSPGAAKRLLDADRMLSECLTPQMAAPGEYTFRMVYDTRPAPEAWVGQDGTLDMVLREDGQVISPPKPDMSWFEPLYRQVPKGLFVSDEVTVRVLTLKP